MYQYADRILMQILAFSVGPLTSLLGTAFINPRSGWILGVIIFFFVYCQPLLSKTCLKNTARALDLGEIFIAEGQVLYHTLSQEQKGKLFLNKEKLIFVRDNQIDFSLKVENILRIEEEFEEKNQDEILKLTQTLKKKSPNLPQVTEMVSDLTFLSSGSLKLSVQQSFFCNEFCFKVTNPTLWVKIIEKLKTDLTKQD